MSKFHTKRLPRFKLPDQFVKKQTLKKCVVEDINTVALKKTDYLGTEPVVDKAKQEQTVALAPTDYLGEKSRQKKIAHVERTVALNKKDYLGKQQRTIRNKTTTTQKSFSQYLLGNRIANDRVYFSEVPGYNDPLLVEKLLGQGGYGEVYQVAYTKNGKPNKRFALKIPTMPLEKTQPAFLNEIEKLQILSAKNNPHIPKIKSGWLEINDLRVPYYMTHIYTPFSKLYPGITKTAADKEKSPMAPQQALELFYMLACGLWQFSQANIVHNDIKLDNIMFYDGLPIIVDYGTAKSSSEINEIEIDRLQGRLYGTPQWLPPELVSFPEGTFESLFYNLGKVCQLTDIWGIGLILMRCLTGIGLMDNVPLKGLDPYQTFLTIYKHFNHGTLLSNYRQKSLRKLENIYLRSTGNNWDYEELLQLMDGPLPQEREYDSDTKRLESTTTRKIHSYPRLLAQKINLLSRRPSEMAVKEFFIATLMELFDMCIATLEKRIKARTLVYVIEAIFPGIPQAVKDKYGKLHFPPIAPLLKIGQTQRLEKFARFGSRRRLPKIKKVPTVKASTFSSGGNHQRWQQYMTYSPKKEEK